MADVRQELHQTQGLVMTAQMRQSLRLLQFSNFDLQSYVDEQLDLNPLLERAQPDTQPPTDRPADDPNTLSPAVQTGSGEAGMDEGRSVYGDSAPRSSGASGAAPTREEGGTGNIPLAERPLRDQIYQQLCLSPAGPQDRLIGAHLIEALDPAGRLGTDPAEIARVLNISPARVEAVRQRMMRFDPPGLFALSLQECLAAQLMEKNRYDPAMAALLDNLDMLARQDLKRLQAACGVSAEDLADMIAELRALNPKPGVEAASETVASVVPDILTYRAASGEWMLELNPDTTPRLVLNSALQTRIALHAQRRDDQTGLTEQLSNANWLIRALQQRSMTILKVSGEIMRRQEAFLTHGVGCLRPLTLRNVADAVQLHESTVSRVTSNKYIATPRGTFALKFFFTTALNGHDGETHSSESIRHTIRQLVNAEPPDAILSDDAIVARLRRDGVDIARRTVAKYRDSLNIPSSVRRRHLKAVSS
ncbi:RNA polymerase factor sigma-54 [Gluconacetobacter azotocaptans]|uniref:RNA polymerase sigma-54 factor n=1 Tax=Gluconacetobacter azotocaptans TaxID=142834 RepID=A0A7W4PE64_9PROT|nr:RNA polymerase factor sigma-54 [Gluconacetobacter azotocaptans]MBB2190380.1 RNA polymerase factor sigma-54 [Gluconacetobacter azotocaptans]